MSYTRAVRGTGGVFTWPEGGGEDIEMSSLNGLQSNLGKQLLQNGSTIVSREALTGRVSPSPSAVNSSGETQTEISELERELKEKMTAWSARYAPHEKSGENWQALLAMKKCILACHDIGDNEILQLMLDLDSCVGWKESSPRGFRPLTLNYLEEIILLFVRVKSLPSLAGFSQLTILSMTDCGIETLPDSLKALPNMWSLDVRRNRLRHLPVWLSHLSALRVLEAAHNLIEELPDVFHSITKLEQLHLENNPLRKLPLSFLSNGFAFPDGVRRGISLNVSYETKKQLLAINHQPASEQHSNTLIAYLVDMRSWGLGFLVEKNRFSLEQQGHMCRWLANLQTISDYDDPNEKLESSACSILAALKPEDSTFRAIFLAYLKKSAKATKNEAALLFIRIWNEYLLHVCVDAKKPKIGAAVGQMNQLLNALQSKINETWYYRMRETDILLSSLLEFKNTLQLNFPLKYMHEQGFGTSFFEREWPAILAGFDINPHIKQE